MKRLLVVDDERPVVDTVSLIVKRELPGEFEIAGTASSGREAIEKAMALSPDIILMDVRMPGISGLDAIREIRKRGSGASFILVTAYERFDIAREAVGLGVLDYLLKPVSKDKLALALRAASELVDRRSELERREIEHREREERTRSYVETAFLYGIMLGERFGPELERYRAALGLEEPLALAVAASFLPRHGSPDPEAETRALHESFREVLRYKSRALAGPLVSGHAFALLPVKEGDGSAEAAAMRELASRSFAAELERGYLKLGFGGARPLEQASLSWAEALAELLGSRMATARAEDPQARADGPAARADGKPFEEDEAFLEDILDGSPERALVSLERLIGRFAPLAGIDLPDRFRVIALFGSAYRLLARRGQLDPALARGMLDLEDLRASGSGAAFVLAVRGRFARLADAMAKAPRWSAAVAAAVSYVRESYGSHATLETAAERVGMSPGRLSRLFVEETGRGFSDYLIEFRLEKAKEMLSTPGASIKQVSSACGYPDPNYFSRLFKKVTGLTPTAFSSGAGTEQT